MIHVQCYELKVWLDPIVQKQNSLKFMTLVHAKLHGN